MPQVIAISASRMNVLRGSMVREKVTAFRSSRGTPQLPRWARSGRSLSHPCSSVADGQSLPERLQWWSEVARQRSSAVGTGWDSEKELISICLSSTPCHALDRMRLYEIATPINVRTARRFANHEQYRATPLLHRYARPIWHVASVSDEPTLLLTAIDVESSDLEPPRFLMCRPTRSRTVCKDAPMVAGRPCYWPSGIPDVDQSALSWAF